MSGGVNHWLTLIVPRFKCGHERTAANSYAAGSNGKRFVRCKRCKDAARAKYQQERVAGRAA